MNDKTMKSKLPPRESETRAKTERRKPWSPPSQLDAPPAPAGFKHRWIRAESVGQMDQKNVSARLREGWEFVRADEYPDVSWPSIDTGRYNGVIAVGGLMLARFHWRLLKSVKNILHKLRKIKMTQSLTIPLRTNILACLFIMRAGNLA